MLNKLSRSLEENIEEITRELLKHLQDTMRVSADELFPTSELQDLPPSIIKSLAIVIDDERRVDIFAYGSEIHHQAATLGRLRESQGFKVSELFEECFLLRDVVLDFCRRFELDETDLATLDRRISLSLNKVFLTVLENYFERFAAVKERMAYADEVTRLYNRRFFNEQLELETQRCKRYFQPLSVLIIDVDNFRPFVKRCGQEGGRKLLGIYARKLEQASRRSDVIARLHGDKFAALLTNTAKEEAEKAGKRFCKSIRDLKMATVSVGISTCPDDAGTPEEIMDKADEALYEAKKSGRNRCVHYR